MKLVGLKYSNLETKENVAPSKPCGDKLKFVEKTFRQQFENCVFEKTCLYTKKMFFIIFATSLIFFLLGCAPSGDYANDILFYAQSTEAVKVERVLETDREPDITETDILYTQTTLPECTSTFENLATSASQVTVTFESTEEVVQEEYILNTNTKVFHYPSCKSVKSMKEKNKKYFCGDRDEVIENGYRSCGNCHP